MSTANFNPILIAGLGNPGKEYEKTRHNVGFTVIDELKREASIKKQELRSKKFNADIIHANYQLQTPNYPLVLAKPQTFMNHSGSAVAKIARFYKIPLPRIWIVYDDIDLPLGTLRIREKGGSGGHNGVQSIIDALGSNEFPRFRLGIGPVPPGIDPADFVLSPFRKEEQKTAEELVSRAAGAIARAVAQNYTP